MIYTVYCKPACTRIALCPGADTEETGRYDLAERFV